MKRNGLLEGKARMIPIPSGIFTSYAIDFAAPFNKSKEPTKQYDMVLVVVDRVVGFCYVVANTVGFHAN